MNATLLWNKFIEENNINDVYYEAWAFGGNPDVNATPFCLNTATLDCQ